MFAFHSGCIFNQATCLPVIEVKCSTMRHPDSEIEKGYSRILKNYTTYHVYNG